MPVCGGEDGGSALGFRGGQRLWADAGGFILSRFWAGIHVAAAAGTGLSRLCARSVTTATHWKRHAGRIADSASVDGGNLVGKPARWPVAHPTAGARTGVTFLSTTPVGCDSR